MTNFENLLSEFKKLPATKRELTLLQVAGYPHYENVCSNILAFYLDPEEEHGLGDLLLQSILGLVSPDNSTLNTITEAAVHREWLTKQNKRIDLVVEFSGGILAIENKVYHHLDNDLAHYAKDLANRYDKDINSEEYESPKFHNALLSPNTYNQAHEGGFKSITYHEVWDAVEQQLGTKLHQASPKWITFLTDFIQTSRNFSNIKTMKLDDTDHFIINNQADINELIKAQDSLNNQFRDVISQLSSIINDPDSESSDLNFTSLLSDGKTWIHAKRCLVFDLKHDEGHRIAIDLCLSVAGWEFQLFARNDKSRKFLNNHMLQHPELKQHMQGHKIENKRYIIKKWHPIEDADLHMLHTKIVDWVRAIAEYMQQPSQPQ